MLRRQMKRIYMKWGMLIFICMLMSLNPVHAEGEYTPKHYESAVKLWEKDLLKGYDGVFDLDKKLTRAEAIAVIVRVLGKEKEAMDSGMKSRFTDVPAWAEVYVAYAEHHGITSGISPELFGADRDISANEYLTFLLRAIGYDDAAGDFRWNQAVEKAYSVGLIDASSKDEYLQSDIFLRDHMAYTTYSALSTMGKDGTTLLSKNKYGSLSGNPPLATQAEKQSIQKQTNQTETQMGQTDTPTDESERVSEAQKIAEEKFFFDDVSLTSLDGTQRKLSELVKKNTVIVFWTSWCPSCVGEMPILQEIADERDDISFVLINVGETRENVEKYRASSSMKLPIFLDENTELAAKYEVRAIPTLMFMTEKLELMKVVVGKVSKEKFFTYLKQVNNDRKNDSR